MELVKDGIAKKIATEEFVNNKLANFDGGTSGGNCECSSPSDTDAYTKTESDDRYVQKNFFPDDITIDGVAQISQGIDPENPVSGSFPDEVAVVNLAKDLLGNASLELPDDLEIDDNAVEIIEANDINSSFDPTDDQVFTSAGVKQYLIQLGLINA